MRPSWLEVYSATDAPGPTGGERGWKAIDTASYYAEPAARFPGPKFALGWIRTHCACLANFVHATSEGRPAEPSLRVGIALQQVMDACYRSAAESRSVAVGN